MSDDTPTNSWTQWRQTQATNRSVSVLLRGRAWSLPCPHYCGDQYLAEELAQEALVRACRRWAYVSSLSSPEGWAYRVAVNLANSAWRRQRAERRARHRHGPNVDVRQPVAVEEQLRVRAALKTLTDQQREAVILRHVLDLSADETAQLLGISTGAVRALTHRAVERLRKILELPTPATEEVDDVS